MLRTQTLVFMRVPAITGSPSGPGRSRTRTRAAWKKATPGVWRSERWGTHGAPSERARSRLTAIRPLEQRRVVDLGLVDEHVCVCVGGHRQAALPDELADPRPR